MPETRLIPSKCHASQSEFQRPSDPMLGQSAAKMNHLLGRLRSHKGQYELVDALAAIARRRRKTLLGCAGNREKPRQSGRRALGRAPRLGVAEPAVGFMILKQMLVGGSEYVTTTQCGSRR